MDPNRIITECAVTLKEPGPDSTPYVAVAWMVIVGSVMFAFAISFIAYWYFEQRGEWNTSEISSLRQQKEEFAKRYKDLDDEWRSRHEELRKQYNYANADVEMLRMQNTNLAKQQANALFGPS